MLVAAIADSKASKFTCRAGCRKPIRTGQVVLHLKLPGNVDIPFTQIHQYFHADCVGDVIATAPEARPTADALFVDNWRREVLKTGELFPAA